MINKHFFDGRLNFCKDFTKIENYSKAILDTSQTWDCHHRRETHYLQDGTWIEREQHLTKEQLIEDGLYYDVLPSDLIFLTRSEHMEIHHHNKGLKLSDESKAKISAAKKGRTSNRKGVKLSEEVKKVIADKIRGRHWYNNGVIETQSYECPEGFTKGRLRT